MERVRVTAIIATDHPVAAYGGIQLSREALEEIADAVRSNRFPMLVQHDATRPLNAHVIDSQVRERADGHCEVWAEFDADREAWESYERDRDAAGAPGGMSIAFMRPYGVFKGEGSAHREIVQIAADAFHFSDEDLADAGQVLAPYVDVQVQRLYQLSGEPPVKVVLEYGQTLLESLPPALFAALVWETLRGFIRKARDRGQSTIIDVRITETKGSRIVDAIVQTDSDEVAEHAVEKLSNLASKNGRFRWIGDDWERLE
jgi:hypothetical protein